MKLINAEKLIAEIERRIEETKSMKPYFDQFWAGQISAFKGAIKIAESLQQEQPIKVYRVENEKEQKGLWRKFDGTWEPLFDMLTNGQCKDMPMDDSPIYREGGKQWFASAPSKETLQKWFSKRDLEELTAKGFTISEFEVIGHKKISDFEYIFTRDSIISRTYLKVSDIYPQEQPSLPSNLDDAAEEYFLKTYGIDNIAISEDIKRAVKFGAEWIVRQGVTEVSRLYRDPNPPHEGLFFGVLPFFSTIQMALNYQDGEEVIVQIRKKQ